MVTRLQKRRATRQVEAIYVRLLPAQSSNLIGYQLEQKNFDLWCYVGFGIIASCSDLISALAIVSTQLFTKTPYERLAAESTLINAWGKLNKKEQDKISKLGKATVE